MNSEIDKILQEEDYIEPETVRHFRGEDTSSLQVLKDMTYNLVTKTRAPYVDFYVFENVVHVLNDIEPDVRTLQGSTVEQIWYALSRMEKLTKESLTLSHEVKAYIKFVYKEEGCLFLPPYGFTVTENPLLQRVIDRYGDGAILEDSGPLDNQAIKYGKILEYLKQKDKL